ncbi:hypothetical protein Bbelb_101930 [Branchiostoma belcheri]|nr:hypothetical protein Bbelb_101930 [Branchiostoma belcheri]
MAVRPTYVQTNSGLVKAIYVQLVTLCGHYTLHCADVAGDESNRFTDVHTPSARANTVSPGVSPDVGAVRRRMTLRDRSSGAKIQSAELMKGFSGIRLRRFLPLVGVRGFVPDGHQRRRHVRSDLEGPAGEAFHQEGLDCDVTTDRLAQRRSLADDHLLGDIGDGEEAHQQVGDTVKPLRPQGLGAKMVAEGSHTESGDSAMMASQVLRRRCAHCLTQPCVPLLPHIWTAFAHSPQTDHGDGRRF